MFKDKRGEAMEYDKNAIGVYRTPSESEQKMLVGHVPIELSSLMNNFLKANDSNKLVAKVSGKRKREVSLVVPVKFKALTKEYRLSKILDEQLQARKEKYTHFEIVHVEKSFKTFPVKIAFKVLAYRFVFVFADSSFSKVWRLIESGRQLNHPSVLLDAGLNRERH